MEWIYTNTNWPDWSDTGKTVQLYTFNAEKPVIGTLTSDTCFDGEDEYPLFEVDLQDGSTVSFGDVDRYRFLT